MIAPPVAIVAWTDEKSALPNRKLATTIMIAAASLSCFAALMVHRSRTSQREDELIFASLIVRHGARGPTKKALYLACGETSEQRRQRDTSNASPPHPATTAAKLWRPEELDALTTVGNAQLVSLGRHFAQYVAQQPNIVASTPIKVRRSERPRVIASANSFMEGYAHAMEAKKVKNPPPLQYVPYDTIEENISVFRAWTGTEYNQHVDQVKHSELYRQKAQTSMAALDATVGVLCQPWASTLDRAGQLNLTTYLHEIEQCEAYCPDASKRGVGSITHYFHQNKTTQLACEELRKLALWSFDKRFIDRQTVGKQWGNAIGGDLMKEIEQDYLLHRGKGGASIYVGHDYTILALMSALGVATHPSTIMGFGGYAIMEYRKNQNNGHMYQRLMLQTCPFPDVQHPSTVTKRLPVEVWRKPVLDVNHLYNEL